MAEKKLGNYIIERELGRGGMGIVYKAHEESLQRVVALKVMSPSLLHDETNVQRFLREARAGARLQHPNIVPVHAVGQADGQYFISMAYVKGARLSDVIRQKGQLPVNQALDIARQIADALAEAHQHDIVHRDIKPDNIMIDEAGRVQVMDFGLAHLMSSQSNLTADHMKVGTARYMAPEQCRGGKVDGRTDLYALGVVLFEMLAGRAPFKADSPMVVMYQITNEPLPALQELNSTVPQEVVSVVQHLTAKDMDKRYASATVVRNGLLQLQRKLAGSGAQASGASQSGVQSGAQRLAASIAQGRRSFPVKKVAIGLGVLAILAVLIFPFLGSNDSTPTLPANLEDAISVPSQSVTPRTVIFPDRKVGMVVMRDVGTSPVFGRFEGPARGSTWVPEGKELGLFVRPDDSADIGFLRDLGPNELDYLLLEHPRITNGDVRSIEHLTGLNYLLVEYNEFTDAGLSSLRNLTNLQFLGLGGTKITDDGLASLTFLRGLTGLSVGGTQITHEGIRSLQSLPLDSIMLAGYALTPPMVEVLEGFPGLTFLRIDCGRKPDADRIPGGDRPIGADTIARVGEITQLRTLMLAGSLHDDSLIPSLSRLTFLEAIIFDGDTSVTAAGRNELRRALPGCTIAP